MTNFLGTQIFWTTVAAVPLILAASALLGRVWSRAFPTALQPAAQFYLAPLLGLGSFVLLATAMGRHLPLGDSIVVPYTVVAVLVLAFRYNPPVAGLKRDLAIISVFGLLCGTSVIAPLYLQGAINTHNDTFTYLVHSDWLQTSAFSYQIPLDRVTPATTQVAIYQKLGLRMGASFLLGLVQALLNVRWALEIYPAVLIATVAACCLAIGFPIAEVLRPLRLRLRLMLLALPSFGLGGLVFGANMGFLPQTVGLALASGAIFAAGPVFSLVGSERRTILTLFGLALPIAVLVAGAMYSYAEVAPFLVGGIALGWLWFAARGPERRNMLVVGAALGLWSALFTNFELLRIYGGLRMQAASVVGTPVPWSAWEFFSHAFGARSGAWDDPQFTIYAVVWSLAFALLLLIRLPSLRWKISGKGIGVLVPTAAILFWLLLAFLYFRYAVPSPFPVGVGQSWSQFKLSEWAHPFVAVMVAALAAYVLRDARSGYRRAMLVLLAVAALGSTYLGNRRSASITSYYTSVADLANFYRVFRNTVLSTCPPSAPIFLSLVGGDHKFRQMASLLLGDREVRSDWSEDGYIFPYLSPTVVSMLIQKENCLVEPAQTTNEIGNASQQGTVVGPLRISVFDGKRQVQVASAEGSHGRESNGSDWWTWVERSVTFRFKLLLPQEGPVPLNLSFEYGTRDGQPLNLKILDGHHPPINEKLPASAGDKTYSRIFHTTSIKDLRITLTSEGEPKQLGEKDTRKAAFVVRNLSITETD